MKKLIPTTVLLLLLTTSLSAQVNYTVKANIGAAAAEATKTINAAALEEITVDNGVNSLTTFKINFATVPANKKYIITVAGGIPAGGLTDYTAAGTDQTFTYASDIINSQVSIVLFDNAAGTSIPYAKFRFKKAGGGGGGGGGGGPVVLPPLATFLATSLLSVTSTAWGYVIKQPTGDEIDEVHMYFDQYGNNLAGTIPQGIANKRYVVHIFHPGYINKASDITYSVKQKSGSYNSSLVFNNTGILTQVTGLQAGVSKNYDTWITETFVLGTASDDLTFDIVATTEDENGKPVKGVLETHTIKMSPIVHGTFDIGLINSTLPQSTFSLVTSPLNSAEKVIKETNTGNTGIVTIMATCYMSPVVVLKRAFGANIPKYKQFGRNFLDDHTLWERFYPTVGVSLSSKSFENLFFGINWEIARGLSIFGGGHWGKVNTFQPAIAGYQQGITPVTQTQFDYYLNTTSEVRWAYGAKLDILLISNLFKK